MGVQVIIYGYGLVCLSMFVFNLLYSAYLRSGDRRSRRRRDGVAAVAEGALESGSVPEGHVRRMEALLSNVNSLLAFDEYLAAAPQKSAAKYLEGIAPAFTRLAGVYARRDDIQIAYFCRFLASWGAHLTGESAALAPMAARFARRKSIYCRVNALKALCALGDEEILLDTLLRLSPEEDGDAPMHEKIIVEALLGYAWDSRRLISLIWSRFERFPTATQRALLDYIRFQSGEYKDEMLDILLDGSRDKELRFSAIRYFGRYPDERALPALLGFVEDAAPSHWEYAAIAATSLTGYPGEEAVGALTSALGSPNWYVRYNSASSLEKLGFTYEDLLASPVSGDRYAREMLIYMLEMRRVQSLRDTKETAV